MIYSCLYQCSVFVYSHHCSEAADITTWLCSALGLALELPRLNNTLGRLVTASVVSRTWYGAGIALQT